MTRIMLYTLIVLISITVKLISNEDNIIRIHRLTDKITLDGKVDEEIWFKLPAYDMIKLLPIRSENVEYRTEVRFTYDDDYLYLSGIAYDDPENIQVISSERDNADGRNDWMNFMIDSFNDKESALMFGISPGGSKTDMEINNDAIGSNWSNINWNTYWDAESYITDYGWTCEIRIPFSSLGFETTENEVLMGITAWRYSSKSTISYIFPHISDEWGTNGKYKPSQSQTFKFSNITSDRAIYFTPYILGGYETNSVLSDGSYQNKIKRPTEFGADLKYGLTSKLTLDLTYNTDFAQVESDDMQIQYNQYSLFVPEKRQFFQERSGTFNFSFEGHIGSRLFHSRSIGIKDGKLEKIYGGARLSGKIGNTDLGLLSLQTETENASVLRLKTPIINDQSFIGGMLTSKIENDGKSNYAIGFDTKLKVLSDSYAEFKIAGTVDSENDNDDAIKSIVKFYNTSRYGTKYFLSLSRSGKNYNPGLGFENRHDYSKVNFDLGYGWAGSEKTIFSYSDIGFFNNAYFRNKNKDLESFSNNIRLYSQTDNGYSFKITSGYYYDDLLNSFLLFNKMDITAKKYHDVDINLGMGSPDGEKFTYGFSFNYGSMYDILTTIYNMSSNYKISSFSNIGLEYKYINNKHVDVHLGKLRLEYMINREFTFKSFVQYSSVNQVLLANASFHYNPREGVDLYLVYNDNFNTDRYSSRIVLPKSNSSSILLKFNHSIKL